jgi:PTH2 family peptidyl-tRNA hydrolase
MSHKQVIVVRRDLNMRKGKAVAQGAHASLGAILSECEFESDSLTLRLDDRTRPWILGQFKKICVSVNSEAELLEIHQQALAAGVICSLIQDSGLTEFQGVKTLTAVAIGPDFSEKIDKITQHLPLY